MLILFMIGLSVIVGLIIGALFGSAIGIVAGVLFWVASIKPTLVVMAVFGTIDYIQDCSDRRAESLQDVHREELQVFRQIASNRSVGDNRQVHFHIHR